MWSLWSHLLQGLWGHQDLRGQGHYIKGQVHLYKKRTILSSFTYPHVVKSCRTYIKKTKGVFLDIIVLFHAMMMNE